MATPFVSIIVPTYNRAHLIKKTLFSLIQQSFENYEIIVIDDGSTDNTEEVVASLKSSKITYYRIKNSERSFARNYGTKKATGLYVNWFDSDDIALSNHCETIYNEAIQNEYPEVLRLNYDIYNPETKYKKTVFTKKNLRKELLKGNSFGTSSTIVKRSVALFNPFNEDPHLLISEDYDLWLRLGSKYSIHPVQKTTSQLIDHPERSVYDIADSAKTEARFLTLIQTAVNNPEVHFYIGKDLNYFKMRNYLVLAIDLAYYKHKRPAWKYIKSATSESISVLWQRLFWVTLKHLIL